MTPAESVMASVIDDVTQRLNQGERPDIGKLAEQYPELEGRLSRIVETIILLHESDDDEDTDDPPLNLRSVGEFKIIRELGRGGMGVVYEAHQESLDRRVALKLLPFAALLDERKLQRFKNEARAAAVLKHPHIVSVHCVGSDRGVHYYAMELIDGHNLAEIVATLQDTAKPDDRGAAADPSGRPQTAGADPIDTTPIAAMSTQYSTDPDQYYRTVARLGVQAADALHYAHLQGIVHRDIKPANLILDRHGNIAITDFGLAITQTDAGLTMSGDLLGTLRYMSPEQSRGENAILDARTDIYSLGITLYELLARRPAYTDSDRHRLLRRIMEDDPKPLRSLDSSIPSDLETIILKATARDPAERYTSMDRLSQDLRCFLDSRPIAAKRRSIIHQTSRWLGRHQFATAVVALVGFAFALLFGIAWQREAKLHTEAVEQRKRAEVYSQLATDLMFDASDVYSHVQLTESVHTLQRHMITKAIDAHRAVRSGAVNPMTLPRLLVWRADNAYNIGRPVGDDPDEAISILESLDASEADRDDVREELSRAYRTQGQRLHLEMRFSEAADAFAFALSLANSDRAEHQWRSSRVAGSLLRSGRPADALESLRPVGSRVDSVSATVSSIRQNVALGQLMRLDEASRNITEAVRSFHPSDVFERFWYATALMVGARIATQYGESELGRERAEEAIALFSEIREDFPDLVWTTWSLARSSFYLGESLAVVGRTDEAEDALRASLHWYDSANRPFDRYEAALVRLRLAQLLVGSEQAANALKPLQRSASVTEEFARKRPNEPECNARLVLLLTMAPIHEFRDAERAVLIAERLPETSGLFWRYRALAQLRAGNWSDCIRYAQESMNQLNGGDCIDRLIMAIAAAESGDLETSRNYLNAATDRMQARAPVLYGDMGPLAIVQLRKEAEVLSAK